MEFSEIFDNFAKRVGADFALDEDGTCRLGIDDMEIVVHLLPELDSVVMYGDVGDLPPEGLQDFYAAALKANWMFGGTSGSTIAINPETNRVVLNRYDPVKSLDDESFAATVEKFVNMLETWRTLARDFGPVALERQAAAQQEALEAPSFGSEGFVRI